MIMPKTSWKNTMVWIFSFFKYLDWIPANIPLQVTDMRAFCSLNGNQNGNHCIR